MLRPMGSTAKPRKTAGDQKQRRQQMHDLVRGAGNDIFLGQRLDAVGDGLK